MFTGLSAAGAVVPDFVVVVAFDVIISSSAQQHRLCGVSVLLRFQYEATLNNCCQGINTYVYVRGEYVCMYVYIPYIGLSLKAFVVVCVFPMAPLLFPLFGLLVTVIKFPIYEHQTWDDHSQPHLRTILIEKRLFHFLFEFIRERELEIIQ